QGAFRQGIERLIGGGEDGEWAIAREGLLQASSLNCGDQGVEGTGTGGGVNDVITFRSSGGLFSCGLLGGGGFIRGGLLHGGGFRGGRGGGTGVGGGVVLTTCSQGECEADDSGYCKDALHCEGLSV